MKLGIQKDNSSNEDDTYYLNENTNLKIKNNIYNKPNYKKKKKFTIQTNSINPLIIIILLLIISVFCILNFFQFVIKRNIYMNIDFNKKNRKFENSNDNLEIRSNETEKEIGIPIIEDIKNLDKNPLGFIIDSKTDEMVWDNTTKKKINIAFIYSTLSANGISRVILVTSKYLLKTGKYNIYFITEKPYIRCFHTIHP